MRKACLILLAACGGGSTDSPPDATTTPADAAVDAAPATAANGTLGAWTAQAVMPTARANHCSAFVGGRVLVIGGNYRDGTGEFVKTDEIHAATVDADGTIGAWQLAGRTPSPVTECNAIADGDRLYVVDGLFDDEADRRGVWTATIDGAGTLGAFARIGELPADREVISSEGAVVDGTLYLMDVELPAEDDDTLTLRGTIAGSSVTWGESPWGIGFRGQPEYAFTATHAYSIGGYLGETGNPMSPTVFVAPYAGGPAIETMALPTPTGFGEAVAVDDWLFVVGGRAQVFGAPGTDTVVASLIGADGKIGAWTRLPALPLARTNHELTLAGDYLVLTGGATNGPGEPVVYTARVRFP